MGYDTYLTYLVYLVSEKAYRNKVRYVPQCLKWGAQHKNPSPSVRIVGYGVPPQIECPTN